MRVIWTPLVLRPPIIQALLKGGQEFTRDRDRPEEFRGYLGELLEQCIDFAFLSFSRQHGRRDYTFMRRLEHDWMLAVTLI